MEVVKAWYLSHLWLFARQFYIGKKEPTCKVSRHIPHELPRKPTIIVMYSSDRLTAARNINNSMCFFWMLSNGFFQSVQKQHVDIIRRGGSRWCHSLTKTVCILRDQSCQ